MLMKILILYLVIIYVISTVFLFNIDKFIFYVKKKFIVNKQNYKLYGTNEKTRKFENVLGFIFLFFILLEFIPVFF